MRDPIPFLAAFEHLPGVFFVVKDDQGRIIAANTATRERLGLRPDQDFIGSTDRDYFPEEQAQEYQRDDRQVLRSGKPLLNRLEAWLDEQKQLQWFLTSKLPIPGKSGKPIGLMILIRRYEEQRSPYAVKEAAGVVAYLRAHLQSPLTTAELAKAVGLSERNLHRKLHQALGVTPHELLLRLRTEAAAVRLAASNDPLSDIALQHGFCDQSAFTKQFRQRTGLTPKQFRNRHQGGLLR